MDDEMMTEGIRDRIVNGLIGQFLGVDLEDLKRGDAVAIRKAAKKLAAMFDFEGEAKEVDDIVAEALTQDWAGVLYEAGDAMMKFAGPHRKDAPTPQINTLARKHYRDMTTAECEQWWSENKTTVRRESATKFGKFALRKLPEVSGALQGTVSAAELAALDPEQVIKWLNRAILLLTAASVFYPPLGVVVVALKLILARYESSNPDVGLPMTALAS